MLDIIINQLDSNADFVILQSWLVKHGQWVKKNDPICEVETSKALIEVLAPDDGILRHIAGVGEEVQVGDIIGQIVESLETNNQQKTTIETADNNNADRISAKAQKLITKYGIHLDELPPKGFILEADVENCLLLRQQKIIQNSGGIFLRLDKINTDGITFPYGSNEIPEGKMDAEFIKLYSQDLEALRAFSGKELLTLLRQHGASIGKGVSVGEGSVIFAPQIVIGNDVSVGSKSTIYCQERFIVGAMARFGTKLELRCQQAVIGSGVFAEDKNIIGGGGHKDPWAIITIGDDSYLGSELMLNTCRPILIGRNVFITNRSILLTHNVGHSYIDGYENRFAPVVLEDHSQVGIASVLYAGARVCSEAVIGSNSYVTGSIPAKKLAMGVPARVVGNSRQTLTFRQQQERTKEIHADFRVLLESKGYDVSSLTESSHEFVVTHEGVQYGLAISFQGDVLHLNSDANWVVWTLDSKPLISNVEHVVMDLLNKQCSGTEKNIWVDTVREYLRKRGIKLNPSPWRYLGGLI